MATPFVRAQAKDNVDSLDNLTAHLDPDVREEVVEYLTDTFRDIEKVMVRALEIGTDPVDAYRAFVAKFSEYWNAPAD